MLNKVICVCSKKDAGTFEVASTYICEFIRAKKYVVLVPQIDYDHFSALNLEKFIIISEDKYIDIADALRDRSLGSRFGWYYQQFIKMSELDDGLDQDLNLIWDADTVPLKELSFKKNGKIFFYQGNEYHAPYFDLIKKLIKEDKTIETSFIAQCLPYRVGWFRMFKETLEADSRHPWYHQVIDLINNTENSGFSEYETLGTYAARQFRTEICISKNVKAWYRFGNSLIGGPKNIERYKNALSAKYDFISFESWDKKRISSIRKLFKLYL
jgi:hypothetical protein